MAAAGGAGVHMTVRVFNGAHVLILKSGSASDVKQCAARTCSELLSGLPAALENCRVEQPPLKNY